MKIVSWNCCWQKDGFTAGKQDKILGLNPDILVVQECRKEDWERLNYPKEHGCWYGDGLEAAGDAKKDLGVGVFSKTWKVEFINEFNKEYRYIVPFRVSHGNAFFNLFAVWTKSIDYGRYDYDKNVVAATKAPEYQVLFDEGAILIGDFNTASNDSDNTHIEYYKNLLSGMTGFTDCAKEAEKHKATFKGQYRNDFCFFSGSLLKKTSNLKFSVHDEWLQYSDHCPIIVTFDLS